MESSFIFTIRKEYKNLRPSEQKVADVLLSPDFDILTLSIESLAHKAQVSQPTVIRFAAALGLKGFKEIKLKLMEEFMHKETAGAIPFEILAVSPKDKLVDVPSKVVAANMRQMENMLKALSSYELIRAVKALSSARTVAIFAVENSAGIARDLATKLLHLGLHVMEYSDSYQQKISALNLGPEDAAVGISYTGTSKLTVEALQMAKASGAATISVTNWEDTVLNKFADIVLNTGCDQYLYGQWVFSRCAQAALVDMLYLGILLTDYPAYSKRITETGASIQEFYPDGK